jgi:poly(3-hydroxybutyrate) depolymerase
VGLLRRARGIQQPRDVSRAGALRLRQPDRSLAYSGGSGGRGAWSQGLSQIAVRTSATTTKILTIFARQGDYSSGPSSRVECPILIAPIIAGDATALVRAPEWTPGTPRDLVLVFHGANSSETTAHGVGGGADDGAAIGGLVEAGYVVAYMRGTSDTSGTTYSGPLASNWGAPGPLATWWKKLLDTIRSKFPIRNVYLLGLSMGLENALRFYATYPEAIKAIAGISGVCNLTYAYNSEGFKPVIDAAHGTSTAAAIAGYDPTLTPSLYTGVPIKLWHGDADPTLAIAQHMTAFAAAVNALSPGRVATVTVAGGVHLGASVFQAAALLAFLQANP